MLLEPCSFPQGEDCQPIWGAAKYEGDYLRVDDVWKFKRVELMSQMWSAYQQGVGQGAHLWALGTDGRPALEGAAGGHCGGLIAPAIDPS